MRQLMMDMMTQMMPIMKPLVWLGAATAAVGVLMVIAGLVLKSKSGGIVLLSGRILLGLAIFLFACELAGMFLGAQPKINFGDFEKMEFILVPFWQIATAFLAGALLLGFIGGRMKSA